jgi:tetraacyldisaccharide 4'-kinase
LNFYFWIKGFLDREHHGRAFSLLLLPLTMLSWLFAGFQFLKRILYEKGLVPSRHAGVPTVCVGNITLGGTGKTPVVETVARIFKNEGLNPVVISRGYGGTLEGRVAVVSDGETIRLSAREAGDEPVLHAKRLLGLGVPVIIGANRLKAAREAVDSLKVSAIVMDDGFGHLRIRRDINVLIVDATRPFGNGYCLPRGILREPLTALSRADIFILTRTRGLGKEYLRQLKSRLEGYNPKAPVLAASHFPDHLENPVTGENHPLKWLKSKKVVAFAGIGNPEAFFSDISLLGGTIVEQVSFPDHHDFSSADIDRLVKFGRLTRADALVTTQKDMQRVEAFLPLDIPVVSLNINMKFEEDGEEVLAGKVRELIGKGSLPRVP